MTGLLVDTGFLIRLLNENEELNRNATDYYRFCLERQIPILRSTIAICGILCQGTGQ